VSRRNGVRYGTCTYCHREGVPLTRDHVVPLSRGGTNDAANVVDACDPCNGFKGDRLLSELPENWPYLVPRLHGPERPPAPETRRLDLISYADDWAARDIIGEWQATGRVGGCLPDQADS
jgi:hypothetical protein